VVLYSFAWSMTERVPWYTSLMWHIWSWFGTHEWVAIWLEGIALVAIFIWDRFDSTAQHTQTLAQLKIAQDQVAEAIRAADAAKTQAESSLESVRLLKLQTQEQQLRELWRVLPILDDIRAQTRSWLNIFDENRWNGLNEATRIMPADSSTVLIQAARHSSELWTEVREAFQVLTNADLQLTQYYGQPSPANRWPTLINAARDNIRNAEPKLTHIAGVLSTFEETERKSHAAQKEALTRPTPLS
jgi:hypothetical protein